MLTEFNLIKYYIIMEPGDKTKIFLNTVIITASTTLEKILFFLITIIIARYLDINEYGEYATALAFASFFSMFTDMGISQTMIRELNYEGERDITIFNIVITKIGLSVILFFVFLASVSFTGYSAEVIYLTVIFGFVRFVDEYLKLYYVYFEAGSRYMLSAIYRLLFSATFLAAVFAVIIFKGGKNEFAWSRFFVVLFFLTVLAIRVLGGKTRRINFEFIKRFGGSAIPFASTFISNNIINQGNMIILPLLHGTVYTGIFQNAYLFLITILFIPLSFERVFIPYLYRHNREENMEKFQFAFYILTKTYVALSFYIAIILFLNSGFIITLIFGTKYSDSISTLKIIALAIPFVFNASYIILTSLDRQAIYSRMLKYAALVSIVLNIVLGYFFRQSGTAYATVITFMFIFLISMLLVKKHSTVRISDSLKIYIRGIIFFAVCWSIQALSGIEAGIAAMVLTSVVYLLLNLLFLFSQDDWRIAMEIAGRRSK